LKTTTNKVKEKVFNLYFFTLFIMVGFNLFLD
jgi:hypothetical protein